MLENETNAPVLVRVWDYDQNSPNFVMTATSSDTNLETVSVSPAVTLPSLTNAIFTVTMALASNQFGIVTNQVVATENGLSTTNTFQIDCHACQSAAQFHL